MEYICDTCNYQTDIKRNFERHQKSVKHNKNLNSGDFFECPYCDSKYLKASGLSRHRQACMIIYKDKHKNEITNLQNEHKLQLKDKNNEIALLKLKLEDMQLMLDMKDTCNNKTLDILVDENKFHKQLVTNSNRAAESSMSAIAYAKKYFPNAKPLVEYTDMEALKTEPKYGIAETMIFYDQNNQISEVIGKIILNKYKEENPDLQSLWNTDFTRVVYIVVEGEGDNKHWVVDKGGVKVKELIIGPILSHIRIKLNDYCYDNAKKMGDKFDFHSNAIYHERISGSNGLIKKIDNGVTAKKVLQFLSKYLHIGEVKRIEA